MDASFSSTTKPLYRGIQIVWAIAGLLEILLVFRLVLKLLAANPEAGFTSFIYTITYPFTAPFLTVFGVSQISGNIFEWTTLLAMFVYGLIAWGIVTLLSMSKSVSTPEAAAKLDDRK